MPSNPQFLYWLSDIRKEDITRVGGKGANLGEMYHAGFPVPEGFVVSAQAYFQFIRENNFTMKINHLLSTINFGHTDSLVQVSGLIRRLIMQGAMSEELVQEIFTAYHKLSGPVKDALVVVSASATAEGLHVASFAGQQETFLNVQSEAHVMHTIKQAWASLFAPRALYHRHEHNFDHFRIGIAVVVQHMIVAEKSGVMFTIDPVSSDKSKIIIEAVYGLGETIVQGTVTPDHFEVDKKENRILKKIIMKQDIKIVKAGSENKIVRVPRLLVKKQKISNAQILTLAELGRKLEKHYFFPQDVQWAILRNKIYIVQTRPITTIPDVKKKTLAKTTLPLIAEGTPAAPGIASGVTKVILTPQDIANIAPGDVVVTAQTSPDYVKAMKKANAIITERGGRTSHASIMSRELGIPAIVGVENITRDIPAHTVVTVDAINGKIYKGAPMYSSIASFRDVHEQFVKTATKIYVNLAEPEFASEIAAKQVDGVGLLRAEFMMAQIGVHPKKMIHDGKAKEYSNRLAENIALFCKPFNPRPVIYRASDFKTNEYRGLIGGKAYEPAEPNPLLGYRGAFRYMHDPNVFKLELEAIKMVREMGFKNLWLEIPFVRSVHELREVKKIISAAGLRRSETFQLWMMVETPAAVVLLDQFLKEGIDGVSIGSNDLTMLLLGTDRDNSDVASAYDEQNPAVLWAYEQVIRKAQEHHVPVSICGQAPSLYPALCQKLVEWGITCLSVSPDAIDSVREHVSDIEKHLAKN